MEELVRGFGLVEGPVWDPQRGLFFSDVHGGGVYLLKPDDSTEVVSRIAKESAECVCTRTVG